MDNIGGKKVPVVIADLSRIEKIETHHLESIGYAYNESTDKWNISDAAADFVFTGNQVLNFELPGTLKVITYSKGWNSATDKRKYFPIFGDAEYLNASNKSTTLNFVMVDCFGETGSDFSTLDKLGKDKTVVICLSSTNANAMQSVRRMLIEMQNRNVNNPVILITDSKWKTPDEHLIHFATGTGHCSSMVLEMVFVWDMAPKRGWKMRNHMGELILK